MKQLNSAILLDQLEATVKQHILQLHYLQQRDPELLLKQPAPGKWSVAQVLEHLNSYGRYYLPHIEKAIGHSSSPAAVAYSPGWIGNYFTKTMLPDQQGVVRNKMSSPRNHRPAPSLDSHTVLQEFLVQEKKLLHLLTAARQQHLGKARVPVSIAPFIKIKLGDTFRFFIAHHQRHFVQISSTLEALT